MEARTSAEWLSYVRNAAGQKRVSDQEGLGEAEIAGMFRVYGIDVDPVIIRQLKAHGKFIDLLDHLGVTQQMSSGECS